MGRWVVPAAPAVHDQIAGSHRHGHLRHLCARLARVCAVSVLRVLPAIHVHVVLYHVSYVSLLHTGNCAYL